MTDFFKVILVFACLYAVRVLQILQLYLTPGPTGDAFVERPLVSLLCALVADVGIFALFAIAFTIGIKKCRKLAVALSILCSVYLLACAVNDQIMRWMGQHLSLSFLNTYISANTDTGLVFRIAKDGLPNFLLSFALIALGVAALVFLQRKVVLKNGFLPMMAAFLPLAVIAGVSFNATSFKPCKIRWKRIQPPYVTVYNEIIYDLNHSTEPANFAVGVGVLGGDASSEFPFYKHVENEDSVFAEFASRPLSERPDIIFLSIESFRGWTADFRIAENCRRMPNLCKMSLQGTSFPYAYSVGFPSTEGMLGLQLGIWSHPQKTFLSDLMNVKVRSLMDILGDAGYHRIILTAAEPSFDNFTPWFSAWADFVEYDPKNSTDVPLANRFVELYDARPKDKPVYFEWINFTTHTPFEVPKDFAVPAANSDERYGQALAYLDSALGIIFETLQKSERFKETIIVLTGDHSIPNGKTKTQDEKLGMVNSGYTWTTMLWIAPGIDSQTVKTHPVSHVDVAPTLLGLLGLNVSNHFVGNNVFDSARTVPVMSFRLGNVAYRTDSLIAYGEKDNENQKVFLHPLLKIDSLPNDFLANFTAEPLFSKEEFQDKAIVDKAIYAMDAWEWVLNSNKLMP